ncbi:Exocyst subunit Exo70 family protein [Abeliophyllum distichum]|uniref:Exocyst subunit Exo70 family protein n=1 Tax=Abeliophyllum distichum TaxID=126358 RepID=A0ABD1SYD4_9LAMI
MSKLQWSQKKKRNNSRGRRISFVSRNNEKDEKNEENQPDSDQNHPQNNDITTAEAQEPPPDGATEAELSSALFEFSSEYKNAYTLNRIDGVLQRAMSYIEEEFKPLLEDHKLSDLDHNNNDSKPRQSTSSNPNQDAQEPGLVEETKSP